MQRFGYLMATALLTSVLAGCDGGLKEGMSEDAAKNSTGQPPGFEDQMKKMGGMMSGGAKRKPANVNKASEPAKDAAAPAK